jgi:signal recognition particle receptor subunit beta
MQVNLSARELTVKLVYYGPALGGKTTNLRAIHRLGAPGTCGQLMTLDTTNDRTLLFDMLPISLRSQGGLNVRLKLFAVPGQIMLNATRRLILQTADGVAFIADSQRGEAGANRESFLNLKHNLEDNGIDPERIPIVVQFNKRDLKDIRTDEELDAFAELSREPIYRAVAMRGHGVMQTLRGLIRATLRRLEDDHGLEEKLGINSDRLVTDIESKLNDEPRRCER